MTDREWLDSLKPGDEAVLEGDYKDPRLVTITSATVARVRIAAGGSGELDFNRDDGRERRRGIMYRAALTQPTPERRAKIADAANLRRLRDLYWDRTTPEQRARIVAILDEKEGP